MKKYLFLLLFPFQILFSQDSKTGLIGLWEITQVAVGEEVMTPFAKWVEFKPDHTQYTGNGWVQHSLYTWQFDESQSLLSLQSINGMEDLFGSFKIKCGADSMTWERDENDQNVVVLLKRIDRLPAAYSDKMIGLWKAVAVEMDNPSSAAVFSFDKNTVLFIRPDRRYSIQNEAGKTAGVWHAHAHRQRIRLLSDEGDASDMNWEVSFEKEKMVWENGSGKTAKVVFERIFRF